MKIKDVTIRLLERSIIAELDDDYDSMSEPDTTNTVDDVPGEDGEESPTGFPPTQGADQDQDAQGEYPQDQGQEQPPQNPQGDAAGFEEPEEEEKPIKSNVFSIVKNDDFFKDYDHSNNSPYNPYKIASMDSEELDDTADKVKAAIQKRETQVNAGLYSDDKYVYLSKLLKFIQKVKNAIE